MYEPLYDSGRFFVGRGPRGLVFLERLPTNDEGGLNMRASALDNSHEAATALLTGLGRERLAWQFQKMVLLKTPNGWHAPKDTNEMASCVRRHVTFGAVHLAWANDEEAGNNETRDGQRVLPPGAVPLDRIPLKLYSLLKGSWSELPVLEGIISHPVWGEPYNCWERPETPKLDDVDPALPHLRKLFSAFDLDEVDSAMLYIFLLGCFHAVSLDEPRPILFIDSWKRGRGKSEVTEAISVLLDDNTGSIALDQPKQALSEEITAHLIGGRRVLAGHNLDEAQKWTNTFLATLATESRVSRRAKYGRQTESFSGVVAILNGIYGCFSLHEDMVARLFRVELGGEPQRLEPRPRQYVRSRKHEITKEILYCHSIAKPWPLAPLFRFNEFETAACAAYSAGFGLEPDAVRELVRRAAMGAEGLREPAPSELFVAQPKRFHDPFDPIVSAPLAGHRKSAPLGARALGMTAAPGGWIPNKEVK
jgi:hypothetical protein